MEANMKIDVEESIVYRFDSKEDLSQCVQLLGEKGYFSDNEDFSNYEYGTLTRVISDVSDYSYPFIKGAKIEYRYFITEDAVVFKREEPKKLRPFKNISEFRCKTSCVIGNVITYKKKDCNTEYTVLFNGYALVDDDVLVVYLGIVCYTLEELMDGFLYYDNGKWHPFGIEG